VQITFSNDVYTTDNGRSSFAQVQSRKLNMHIHRAQRVLAQVRRTNSEEAQRQLTTTPSPIILAVSFGFVAWILGLNDLITCCAEPTTARLSIPFYFFSFLFPFSALLAGSAARKQANASLGTSSLEKQSWFPERMRRIHVLIDCSYDALSAKTQTSALLSACVNGL